MKFLIFNIASCVQEEVLRCHHFVLASETSILYIYNSILSHSNWTFKECFFLSAAGPKDSCPSSSADRPPIISSENKSSLQRIMLRILTDLSLHPLPPAIWSSLLRWPQREKAQRTTRVNHCNHEKQDLEIDAPKSWMIVLRFLHLDYLTGTLREPLSSF